MVLFLLAMGLAIAHLLGTPTWILKRSLNGSDHFYTPTNGVFPLPDSDSYADYCTDSDSMQKVSICAIHEAALPTFPGHGFDWYSS